MDALSDYTESGSAAKRLRLDVLGAFEGAPSIGDGFSDLLVAAAAAMGPTEGSHTTSEAPPVEAAPSVESMIPIPAHSLTPTAESVTPVGSMTPIEQESLSEDLLPDSLDTSQDSLELDDDNASTITHFSELSGLSDLSHEDWKPSCKSMIWIQKKMQKGVDPRTLLSKLGADSDQIPQYVDDLILWKLIINMLAEPPRRHKLRHVNTVDDVVRLLKGAKKVIILTGAGVSVSCGIPDFRSRDGIYLRLALDFPDLPDPQAMFDIKYFCDDPRPFYKFARDIYPGKFKPSPCHRFIKLLETHEKLLRNYSQNIDTLEKVANIERVIECHGSFATATCTKCGHQVTADAIRETMLDQRIPLCEKCHGAEQTSVNPDDLQGHRDELRNLVLSGIMKPDIVFFGEGLPGFFHKAMVEDKNKCDLLLVIGSSLKVRPVALIPSSLPPEVPQILINRETLPHCHFDVELLGDCDVIVNHICQLMGGPWEEGVYNPEKLQETLHLLPADDPDLDRPSPVPTPQLQSPTTSDFQDQSTNSSENLEPIRLAEDVANAMELRSVKERHMSIDSARDSGIGENSNFTEKFDEINENTDRSSPTFEETEPEANLRGYWQSQIQKNLAERLPPNSFYLMSPSRYVFPGAEIFYEPNERYKYFDDTSSSDS